MPGQSIFNPVSEEHFGDVLDLSVSADVELSMAQFAEMVADLLMESGITDADEIDPYIVRYTCFQQLLKEDGVGFSDSRLNEFASEDEDGPYLLMPIIRGLCEAKIIDVRGDGEELQFDIDDLYLKASQYSLLEGVTIQ